MDEIFANIIIPLIIPVFLLCSLISGTDAKIPKVNIGSKKEEDKPPVADNKSESNTTDGGNISGI